MTATTLVKNPRQAEFAVDTLFLNRWSPRAMSGETVSPDELMSLFEAARWAPSSFNNQPWRFVYAHRSSGYWNSFLDLLVEFNQSWAKNAGVLVLVISRKAFEMKKGLSRTHSFDAGAAWMSLALQASLKGLVAHGMEGFDYERARRTLNIPDDYDVEAMIAIGRPGKKEDLPIELQEREFPNSRKKVGDFCFEGIFQT